jgi:two-component system sensor histidine kinase HydH
MKIFKKVRLLIISAIILNLILIVSISNTEKRNLGHFKAHMVNYGKLIMKTLEGGNRIFMMNMGFSRHNLELLADELAKNESVKNLIIFDEQGKILFSIKNVDNLQLKTLENGVLETENELILRNKIIFDPARRRFGMMGRFDEFPREKIVFNAFLIMDLTNYNNIKREIFLNIFFIIATEVLLIFIALYLFKIFKSYINTQEKLKKIEKEAELGKFANVLAHEIKNPLSSMKGLVEFSAKKVGDDKIKDYLSKSLEEIERLNKIVNDFLSFGRPVVLDKKVVDIKSIFLKAMEILRYDISNKNINVEIEGETFSQSVDSEKILQVVINLLLNALTASPANEKIKIILDNTKKSFKIINKIVNKDFDENKLFEPFYSTRAKGSGLGLSICRKIIELHDGEIIIESTNPFVVSVNLGKSA